jgi:hypothetical protein
MMTFEQFEAVIRSQVKKLLQYQTLYLTDIDKYALYDLYLSSFPPGTNDLYLERTLHDCSACKQFIRTFGGVVAIDGGKMISVWDIAGLDDTYTPVAAALSDYVKSKSIVNQFLHTEGNIGVAKNVAQLKSGEVRTWHHLHAVLPSRFVVERNSSVGAAIGELRDRQNVLMRSLSELTADSIETVLDLIAQNSLYRGEEFKPILVGFLNVHQLFSALPDAQRDLFCWDNAVKLPVSVSKIRNSSIGTLLIDLSADVNLDVAVRKFEAVVAPTNYKRPKAVFSKRMLEAAQNKTIELGLLNSLPRRFATVEDIQIQNILFANTDIMRQVVEPNVFAQMLDAIPASPRKFEAVEEISIDKFIADILPRTTSIDLLLENRHGSNLASVIAPVNADAPSMFKWDNAFSWAYSGNITDSMKQRVKDAGGNVDGVLRFSIQWNEDGDNQNDFDAHCVEPSGNRIYYPNKTQRHPSSGVLDVDIITPGDKIAVENITWSDLAKMPDGKYQMMVHTYSCRGGQSGFRAEIEFNGEIHSFDYPKFTNQSEYTSIATVTKHQNKFSIKQEFDSTLSTKTLWGKQTNQFHPVSVMMFSPNYWDEQQGNGNKHFLFMLDGCISDEKPNGFFNEFLRNDLIPHKHVFEALGNKMQVTSDNPKQLSGIGFSSTQRNNVVCKITGRIQRTLKIIF